MIDIPVRRLVRRFGFDVERRRTVLADLLERRGVDVVLDVGANEGQFGRRLRAWGYRGRIVSFEPLSAAFEVLAAHAERDGNWEVHNVALGAVESAGVLNVAADTVFSSLRRVAPELEAAFPDAAPECTEAVTVRRLDTLLTELDPVGRRPFLKVDVQGFEMEVLQGAAPVLDRMVGVQVEVTLNRLYVGESTMAELTGALERHRLILSLVEPVAYDPASGAMLALDVIFLASSAATAPVEQDLP